MEDYELEARSITMAFLSIVKDMEEAKKCASLSVSIIIDNQNISLNGKLAYWKKVFDAIREI